MGKRLKESESIAIALLYRLEYAQTELLSYEKALEFNSVIDFNLDNMSEECVRRFGEQVPIYTVIRDENRNRFAMINSNIDTKRAWNYYVYCLPTSYIKAIEMDNALETIGLIDVNGKIVDRKEYYDKMQENPQAIVIKKNTKTKI